MSEYYINFGTSLGAQVRTPEQYFDNTFPRSTEYQEDAVRVIDYETHKNEVESLKSQITILKDALEKEILKR